MGHGVTSVARNSSVLKRTN